ncbi:hypothetical protein MMC10_010963 [Thelotrema lepadinum]|nr:hypothetical protein [Thelotrema lepadinum]
MKVNVGGKPLAAPSTDLSSRGFEYEFHWSDPKEGELFPNRLKSGENLMEDRSGSDVQIDRQI